MTVTADDGDSSATAEVSIAVSSVAPTVTLPEPAITPDLAAARAKAAAVALPRAPRAPAAGSVATGTTPEPTRAEVDQAAAAPVEDAEAVKDGAAAEMADVAAAAGEPTAATGATTGAPAPEVVAPVAEVRSADGATTQAAGVRPEPVFTAAGSVWAALGSRLPMLAWLFTPLLALALSTGIARVRVRVG